MEVFWKEYLEIEYLMVSKKYGDEISLQNGYYK